MPNSESSFLRQVSKPKHKHKHKHKHSTMMEHVECGTLSRKRVMVVVDESLCSKHAMLWALTHVANKQDIITLLIHIPNNNGKDLASQLVASLGNLCKASRSEVQVEALVIEGGPKLETIVSQVKKLDVSVLVLGRKHSSPFLRCLGGMSSTEKFVEQCINTAECLTIGVTKQSNGIGGYLISTRWRKDFWLLA